MRNRLIVRKSIRERKFAEWVVKRTFKHLVVHIDGELRSKFVIRRMIVGNAPIGGYYMLTCKSGVTVNFSPMR